MEMAKVDLAVAEMVVAAPLTMVAEQVIVAAATIPAADKEADLVQLVAVVREVVKEVIPVALAT